MEHSGQKSDKLNCANPLTIPMIEFEEGCICVCFSQYLATKEAFYYEPYLLTPLLLSKNATSNTKIFLKSIFYRYDCNYYYLTLVCKRLRDMIRLVLIHNFKEILPIFCDIEYGSHCQSNLNSKSDSKRNPSLNYYPYQEMTVKL